MNYRLLYHKEKKFYYKNFCDLDECKENYDNLLNDNKILVDVSNTILYQYGNEDIIKKISKYNKENLFNKEELEILEKKYHIAIYFMGHFVPNCEDLVELQLNNYVNCTFDIYILTEKVRLYGRFLDMKKTNQIFGVNKNNFDNEMNDEKIYKIFGKYSKNIKCISYLEDNIEEYNKLLNDNKKYYEEKFNTKLKNSIEREYYKFYKAFLLKEEYQKKSGVKYDFIIKTRPDLILKNQIKFTKYYEKNALTKVFGRNNIFIIGNEENMDWISKVIKYYYRYDGKHGCETQLKLHIKHKGLDFLYKYHKSSGLKPIKMFRLWILNKENYFNYHTSNITDENEKKFWQIYE